MYFCPKCFITYPINTVLSKCNCGYKIDSMPNTQEIHPIQLSNGRNGTISAEIAISAYEVYCNIYGEQPALINNGCRGGFGNNEIIAFLYVKQFPKQEWKSRIDEAFENIKC